MLLGGRGELPRQCWEKLLELCTSGLHVLRDCFKKLQLSHLNSGKGRTIHTDCAGEERQSLLMELISWYLFMGERMATAGAQAAHKAHGHTRGPRCRRAELQREGPVPGGNRLGQKATLVHQSQPGFLHGCPKHTKTTVFSPTHMKATVRGWGAGRAEEEAATAPSTRAQSLREASKATEPGARRGNSVSVVLSPRGKCCFPSRFTTNLLKQQLSLLIRCNYQLCDPESSLSEIFLHSSSSYSLFSIFSMASNRLSNSNSQAKSSSKKVMVANK